MIRCAPSLRQSAPVARPTGPRPVISTASLPLMPIFSQAFVDGAEAAGHLRAIGVGEFGGQMDQVLLLGEEVFGHAAVALPAVGAAVLLAGAGDHVAAAAIVAHAAAGDVIDDDAVAHAEAAAAGARLDDLAARLVAGDHALVAFRAFAQVLVIDAADVRAADGGRLHAQQHFAVARLGDGHFFQFDRAVAGQDMRLSLFDHSVEVPEIFPGLVLFPEEHLPFDEAAVPVDGGDGRHIGGGQRRARPRLADSPGSCAD